MLNQLRELPNDIEAEQALLGAVMARNAVLDELEIQPEHFYEPVHAAIFAAMRRQWLEHRCVNVATLRSTAEGFPSKGEFEPVTYLKRLYENGDPARAHLAAPMLVDLFARRNLCQIAYSMDAAAREQPNSVTDVAGAALEDVATVLAVQNARKRSSYSLGEAFEKFYTEAHADTSNALIPTGLSSIDSVVGGWRRKQFAIVAGRPSMGKTTVATSAMLRTAKKGIGVMCFSLEMPVDALAARCLSDLSWSPERNAPYSRILAKGLNTDDDRIIGPAAAHFKNLPIVIDDQRGLTIHEIAARARQQAQRWERDGGTMGLVVVDHLGLIKPSGRYSGNKVHEVGEISDGLATMAKELDVAVVALHQLNRGTEQRDNKRPTLADLRDSGNLEQDADVVCLAYRQAYYLERTKYDPGSSHELEREAELDACRNTLELMVAKNRNGPTNSVQLFCDMSCNVVRDLAHG